MTKSPKLVLLAAAITALCCLTGGRAAEGAVQTVSGAGNQAIDANGIDDGVSMTAQNVAESTLTVADGQDVNDDQENTAAIITSTNNKGNVTLNGTSTVYGTVGSSSLRVNNISAGASGASATFTSTIFSEDFTVSQDGDVTLQGDANVTNGVNFAGDGTLTLASGADLTGAITNTVDGEGTLSITTGSSASGGAIGSAGAHDLLAMQVGQEGIFTLGHDVAAQTVTIYHAGTLITSGNRTITGNVVLNDTNLGGTGSAGALTVGTTALSVTGTYSMAASTTLNVTAAGASSFGSVTATGNTTLNSASIVNVNVGGYIPGGTTMTVINGGGAGVGTANPTVTDNSATLSFTASTAGGDTTLTATRNTVASGGNAGAVGQVMNSFGSSPSADMAAVLGALDSLATQAEAVSALDQLDPSSNGADASAGFLTGALHLETVTGRLADLRYTDPGSGPSGVSTGDAWYEPGLWVKGYGAYADQDARGGVNGYTSDQWGVTAGADGLVGEGTRLGFAGGYSPAAIEHKGDAGSMDVQTYQGTVYAGFVRSPWYVNTAFAFGWHSYESKRNIRFGSVRRTAESEYDGQQYTTYAEAGYPIQFKSWVLAPLTSLEYSHLSIGSYTETGAGDLSLNVGEQDYDLLQLGLGAKLEYPMLVGQNRWVPEVHAKWLYDFMGDAFQTTSSFVGGGAAFSTQGADPAQHALNAGVGLVIYAQGGFTLSGNYNLILKEDYLSHSGEAVLRYSY